MFGLTLSLLGQAQNCTPLYKNTYGSDGNDEALSIIYTSEKHTVVVGRTTSGSSGDYDGFVMKLDNTGNIQWSKNFGGPGYDEIRIIKQTIAGDYIASGLTKSFGNSFGEPFLIKLDASGNIIWTTKYLQQNTAQHETKDIIELKDGNFAVLFNSADSTDAGNAIVAKIDLSGNIVWAKMFDNGRDDGFNSLVEESDSLVIAGYSVGNLGRQGVFLKLRKSDGLHFWSKSIKRFSRIVANYTSNIIMIDTIRDGIAFSSYSAYDLPLTESSSGELSFLKVDNSGSVVYEIKSGIASAGGYRKETISAYKSITGGFYSLTNEYTDWGYPTWLQFGKFGHKENGRRLYNEFQFYRILGFDEVDQEGFLFAGYYRSTSPTAKNKITVIKSDYLGLNGNCSSQYAGEGMDTVHHSFSPMIWSDVSTAAFLLKQTINLNISQNNFRKIDACEQSYCEPNPRFDDSCNSTFFVNIHGDGIVRIFDTHKTDNGDFLSTGSYSSLGRVDPYLLKLSPSGKVIWSKSLVNYMNISEFKKIIPLSDGNYIIYGDEYFFQSHQSLTKSVILKIDPLGNILSTKLLEGVANSILNMVPTNDGGVIFTTQAGSASTVMRLDKTFNIVWSKQSLASFIPEYYRSIYLDGEDLYIGLDYNNFFRLEKWNAQNATRVWHSRYSVSGTIRVLIAGIFKSNDSVVCILNCIKDQSSLIVPKYTSVVKFKSTGELAGGFNILVPNETLDGLITPNGSHRSTSHIKTSDGNIVHVAQALQNDSTYLFIHKYNMSGQVIFSKKYESLNKHNVLSIQADGDNLLISGRITLSNFSDPRQNTGFIMNIDQNGDIKESAIGYCENKPAPFLASTLNPINLQFNEVTGLADYNRYSLINYGYSDRENKIMSSLACNLPSTCSEVTVVGPDSICDTNTGYLFEMRKNPGCISPAMWIVDTSKIRVLSKTDSTLRVEFIGTGNFQIKARLSAGCNMLTGLKNISVFKAVAGFSIGPDTSICPGNTIRLNARDGYSTYRWQDGSSDSTLLILSPGIYFVRVTDHCGNSKSDTIQVAQSNTIPVNVGPDRVKCNNDTVILRAPQGFLNYTWAPNYNINSTANRDVIVNPLVDTSYFLMAEKTPGCFAFDTIHVKVNRSPFIDLGIDTSLCSGDSLVLDPGLGFTQYLWNTGSTSKQIVVNGLGTFRVEASTSEGCKSTDSVKILSIHPLPNISLNKDTGICFGTIKTLDAGLHSKYLWSDGSTTPTLSINQPGTYYVQVWSNRNCSSKDSVQIRSFFPKPAGFLGRDTTICQYGSMRLLPETNYESYLWNNNSQNKTIEIKQPGNYWLEVTDRNNCAGRDSITVNSKECLSGFYIPNAFTPDNDGRNDTFKPLLYGRVIKYRFEIFNRWGQRIFFTQQLGVGWDGKINQFKSETGTYIWKCQYQLEGAEQKNTSGTFLLIR